MKSSHRLTPLVTLTAAFVVATVTAACGGDAFAPIASSGDDAGPSTSDASSDSATTQPGDDAAPSSDAGTDARDTAPPPASWCDGHAGVTLCEDFDESPDLAALVTKWNGGVLGNGTLFLLADPTAPSAPRAFVATAGNNDAAALVHAPFPVSNPSTIRVEYDLRVNHQSVGLFDAAPLVALVLGSNPDSDTTLFLYLGYGGGLTLGWSDAADAGRGFHYYSITNATPTAGTWYGRWGLELSMVDGHMTVLHEGAPIGGPTNGLALSLLHTSSITLAAGLPHDSGGTGMVSVQIDNLVLDVK